ncbi:nucleotide sugar dehydrogenase [Geminicoccaceae bacterium 1502E]|nr:nucleotide sugar dehydrogenase [Geminicoccaceae bacterium 1502E]
MSNAASHTEELEAALEARLAGRTARIGIVGMGYVGLPLMLAASEAGFHVLGFDIDAPKVENLNRGLSPLAHIGHERVADRRERGLFEATCDFARAAQCDALLLCVPTPLGRHHEPDLSFVEGTARSIAPHIRPGQLVVLESTTWPGTTREVLKPLLEAGGLVSGRDFFLAYSPEREDPGNRDFETARIPRVVGGDGEAALRLASALYRSFVCATVPVSSTDLAEAVKLTENIFRSVNIALVNELKTVFTAMGIDVFEVIEAAATKPFGYMPFRPGPGLGGHCIPIDPFYLTWRAREFGVRTRFVELAGEINTAMPAWVVARLAEALDARTGKGLNGARILLVGIAYKKNVDDMRESPALTVWRLLEARGALLSYHDPHVPVIPPTREHAALAGRRSVPLEAEALRQLDAALVITDHDAIDWSLLQRVVPLLVDTRNRLSTGHASVVPA